MKIIFKAIVQAFRSLRPHAGTLFIRFGLPALVFCNLCVCYQAGKAAFARKHDPSAEVKDLRAFLLWDVRNSTSIVPAGDHQMILHTVSGPIIYEFDGRNRTLSRGQGANRIIVLRNVEAASFFLCQPPVTSATTSVRAKRGSANSAGVLMINWSVRNANGPVANHTAVACL